MTKIICSNCKKEDESHAKGLCYRCYKKYSWKPKEFPCKRCKRTLPIHAKGFCQGCYSSLFQIEKIKAFNKRKLHNVDYDTYHKVIGECVICGFTKIVDLHHLDHNRVNNSSDNLIGLCPNHHRMLHHRDFQHDIYEQLTKKGYKALKPYDPDSVFKAKE